MSGNEGEFMAVLGRRREGEEWHMREMSRRGRGPVQGAPCTGARLRSPLRPLLTSLLLVALVLAPGSARAQDGDLASRPTPASVRARVDSLARAFVARESSPGLSVQVVWHGDTLVRAGYGMADLEHRLPATAATVYRIGSITKQFTSSAVMRLVEQHRVALDDSIAAYVPGLPQAWRGVTVRQLLNHTSGIPSYTNIGPRWIRRWGEDMPTDTLVALTAKDSMWFAPGTKWRYDNTGYVLLGMLLDRVTGLPYPAFIESGLVRPLGLQHTFYCDDRRVIPGRARGYERDPDGWRNATYLSMTQPYSAGALCSTVGDLARWDALLASGRVVGAESWRAMTTPFGAADQGAYGFGLSVDRLGGHPMISHSGGINGFTGDNAIFLADSLTITVLTNAGSARPELLLRNIARVVLAQPLPVEPPRVALTTAERARYMGRYEIHLPGGGTLPMSILAGTGALMAQAAGQPVIELIPMGNHTFRAEFDPTLRITFKVEGERATSFTLLQGGTSSDAPRVGDAP
jgi:CubicO group peptidase (beta-lactamase class C family)